MRFGFREFVFVILLLSLPGASYFMLFRPKNAQIAQAREETRKKQGKLDELEKATEKYLDLEHEIEKIREAVELYEQQLPEQREVEGILKEVWTLADRNDLVPKSVRTDKIISTGTYAELPIKMVIVGDFDGFYNFLSELERLPRITRLPQMKLKKSQREEGVMQADIVLSIFFEGESQRSAQANGA